MFNFYYIAMEKLKIKIATEQNASIIKILINKMYGIEYETRSIDKICEAIANKLEFYTLAYFDNQIIGFAGASKNKDYLDVAQNSVAVIDYIYIEESNRDLITAYSLIKSLFKQLIDNGFTQALLQVQTFNKQRFLHYALSDKNIIKEFPCSYREGFNDQILLINDLTNVYNLSLKELYNKCSKYIKETK